MLICVNRGPSRGASESLAKPASKLETCHSIMLVNGVIAMLKQAPYVHDADV